MYVVQLVFHLSNRASQAVGHLSFVNIMEVKGSGFVVERNSSGAGFMNLSSFQYHRWR